ncbi:MAG: fatty acyl-CoA synthetase [Dermatophilaceae bacterium]
MTVADDVPRMRHHGLADLVHRSAARYADKLAVSDGDVALTYAEFETRVEAAAAALAGLRLRHGDRLALVSRNSWQFAVLNFATARLGLVLVPINFMLGAGEIAFILDHSGARAFVAQAGFLPVAREAIARAERGSVEITAVIPGRDGAAEGAGDGWIDAGAWFSGTARAPEVVVADDDPIRLMYTSGTESRPKGVLHSSRSLLWQYVSCIADGGMDRDDVELHTLPLYHCAQLDCFLGPDIYLGASSVLLPAPDPAAILATIERAGVTKYFAPPTVWIGLLRHPGFDGADLSSLRKGYYGASPMPVEVLKELQDRLPEVSFWNFYGQTEMAPLATILRPNEQLAHAGSAGRASLNVETIVVDDADQRVAPGVVGEIVHRSPHATLGYYNDPDKTAEAFRGGWFHSGDLGYLDDDGHLHVVDRKKDMIKSGGENVASREVEEAIYLLDGVAEVAVFGIPHPLWVESVTAVVVPKAGADLTEEAVIAHTRSVLAGFKTPKHVVFADALPKNPSGKILKRDLRQEHAGLGAGD